MHPLSVINPPYFAPYPIDLTFTVNAPGFNADQVVAFDVCGRAIFMSKPSKSSGKKFLVDAISGRPLFTLKSKSLTAHKRWQVFKGESTNAKDLLFSIKQSSAFQSRREYDMFFFTNKKEKTCDFKIKGSISKKKCTVYQGESSFIVAQMTEEHRIPVGGNTFGVKIHPGGIDVAFIAAFIVILHEVEREDSEGIDEILDAIVEFLGT
ncbi:protein LURP-one-related 15-like [Asparagus officinalis]|uniref:protein LURP-one-related 15-like n=1 Tax=Asparagus officinalis TaxID=4686 RepID=UPI00098E1361|nr:protein LURP-one-related 15-like [Asparagus officinalis]